MKFTGTVELTEKDLEQRVVMISRRARRAVRGTPVATAVFALDDGARGR